MKKSAFNLNEIEGRGADVFAISIPSDSDVTLTRYSAAIERVQELARARQVDGWYTSDQTHYARVASYRPR